MIQAVLHCDCGAYILAANALAAKWHPTVDAATGHPSYACPRCRKAELRARVRSALQNGVRMGTKDLSVDEREAAAQVLGPELLETVDGGWGEAKRRETPPGGVPIGSQLSEVDGQLFHELSVMYEWCRARAPGFQLYPFTDICAECDCLVQAVSPYQPGWSGICLGFRVEPCWESLRGVLAECIRIIEAPITDQRVS